MLLVYVFLAIIIFGILIFTHELGHFLAAKSVGVRVNEFSVCMGPVLWKTQRGETTYSLRCIPIGGFCAMEGEDGSIESPRSFSAAGFWQRIFILIAGATANFLVGLLILLIVFSSVRTVATQQIDYFYKDSTISRESGLMEEDILYSIDGERVYQNGDISMLLGRNKTGNYDIEVLRNGQKIRLSSVALTKKAFEENGKTVFRYGIYFKTEEMTFGKTIRAAFLQALDFARLVRLGLQDIIRGLVGIDQMSGPVGIVSVMANTGRSAGSVSAAAFHLAYFSAFLAINLGVMNLLPIPALDGGRVFFQFLSGIFKIITGKKPNPKIEAYIHGFGMILLLAFMAFISLKDIIKLF